ncbi:hypothetical protein [Caulobacter segnis]|uniref:Uncharacterized protein n=1 Tax=Caulobacter segnis TaxID=88688 RepID=A0A2W5XDX8_9CAUL|nr:hypothetical protein [Caulobacter segnis]PZR35781.1 MAG: hypothetical protein DI526_05695 [Caulobacter segnis]
MSFAIRADGVLTPLPYQPFEVGGIQYPANVLTLWSPEDLAEIGVYPRIEADPAPAGQVIEAVTLELRDGVVYETPTYGPAPPSQVPARISEIASDFGLTPSQVVALVQAVAALT